MTSLEQIEYAPIMAYFTNVVDQHFKLNEEAANPITMLEIGCGPGTLTTFIKRHYKKKIIITAIDPSAESIAHAKSKADDIDFHNAGIFDWKPDTKYDLIFFSKSLHHCNPVDKALQNAHALMADNGILISEEVFPDDLNEASIGWFFDRLNLITKCGLVKHREHPHDRHNYEWETKLFDSSLPYTERWIRFGNSECAASESVKKAIYAEFGEDKVKFNRTIPFYFHFLVQGGLLDNETGEVVLAEWIAQEKRAISEGKIMPLGGNYVVHK